MTRYDVIKLGQHWFGWGLNVRWQQAISWTIVGLRPVAATMSLEIPTAHNMLWGVGNDYNNVIMSTMASQITSLTIDHSTVYSGANQRKHQSSASLAFQRGIHRRPVNSPHKGQVTRKMFQFDGVIMVQVIGYYEMCFKMTYLKSQPWSDFNNRNFVSHGVWVKSSKLCEIRS